MTNNWRENFEKKLIASEVVNEVVKTFPHSVMQQAVSDDGKWPIILHSSLQNTDVFTQLNTIHKVRGIFDIFSIVCHHLILVNNYVVLFTFGLFAIFIVSHACIRSRRRHKPYLISQQFVSFVFIFIPAFLVSGSIIESSVIFPKSAVAFLILAIRDISLQNDRFALEEKIVKRCVALKLRQLNYDDLHDLFF